MTDLNETRMAQLAREMVMNIRGYQDVFADFGITEEDYYEICKNPYYRRVKEHLALEWNATTSTADRIKLQNAAGIEVIMPVIGKRMLQPTEPLTSVIEGAKLMAKIAGLGEAKASAPNAAERFVITINLGADVDGKQIIEHYDKSVAIDANDTDVGQITHQNDPKG